MSDSMRFSPRKKSPAVYFNNGKWSVSVQQDRKATEPDPKLVKAVEAAREEFFRVYQAGDEPV